MRLTCTALGIMLLGAVTYSPAQWLKYPDGRTPRTKEGKPNLNAPAPRPNGNRHLSGLWQAEMTPEHEYERFLGKGFTALQVDTHHITKHVLNVFWGMYREEEPL